MDSAHSLRSHPLRPCTFGSARVVRRVLRRYGPNIAHWILTHAPFNSSLPLTGIAAGNACWGGDEHNVNCNGPNEEKNDLNLFHGKGLISTKLYTAAMAACGYDQARAAVDTIKCEQLLSLIHI